MKVNLAAYDNSWYRPGPKVRVVLWMMCQFLFFNHSLAVFSAVKCRLLRLFGARVGKGVLIKPSVQIKYPWLLSIGDYCWIGEKVWIDNLAEVKIGSHVCISQGALLLTGNHNYNNEGFDLIVKPIVMEDGVWIGAQAVICPGTYCETHSMLTVKSVGRKRLDAYTIYEGNPAIAIKKRIIQ